MKNGPTKIGDLATAVEESPGELIFELQKKITYLYKYFANMLFLIVLHVRSVCYKPGVCRAFEKRCINKCNKIFWVQSGRSQCQSRIGLLRFQRGEAFVGVTFVGMALTSNAS